MVGPVLHQEMLIGSRSGRWHWLRWVYAGYLVLVLCCWLWFFWIDEINRFRRPVTFNTLSSFSSQFLYFFTFQHFLLLNMAVPVLAAGSITDEKSRGTLQYLLTADLLSWELVLGKLIGRSYQALLLALIGFPLFCFFGVCAGLDPIKLAGFFICSVVLVFSLGSASILASVWCRHTRDAVLSLYFLGLMVFLGLQVVLFFLYGTETGWLEKTLEQLNPFLPLGSDWFLIDEGTYFQRLLFFIGSWGSFGLVCLIFATWRLRRAYVRQLESGGKPSRVHWWHLSRPRIRSSPLTWKERYVEGVAPLGALRNIPTWLGVVLVFFLTLTIYTSVLLYYLPTGTSLRDVWNLVVSLDLAAVVGVFQRISVPHDVFFNQGWIIMLVTVVIIGVRCSGAITREREKQTWEALLLTPMSTRQLIRGKMWGIAGACVPYLIAYAIAAIVMSVIAGPAALLWTALWLGVMIVAIFYAAATGICCSVRAKSSWRSLLSTLAFIFVGGLVLLTVTGIFSCILAVFIFLLLRILSEILQLSAGFQTGVVLFFADWSNSLKIGFCLALGAVFVLLAWRLLVDAEYRVGVLERTKHWRDEPKNPLARRRRPVPRVHEPQWD